MFGMPVCCTAAKPVGVQLGRGSLGSPWHGPNMDAATLSGSPRTIGTCRHNYAVHYMIVIYFPYALGFSRYPHLVPLASIFADVNGGT